MLRASGIALRAQQWPIWMVHTVLLGQVWSLKLRNKGRTMGPDALLPLVTNTVVLVTVV